MISVLQNFVLYLYIENFAVKKLWRSVGTSQNHENRFFKLKTRFLGQKHVFGENS